jgi:hypothetical protein
MVVVEMTVSEVPGHVKPVVAVMAMVVMAVAMVVVMAMMMMAVVVAMMMASVLMPAATPFPLRTGESGIGSQKHRGTHGQHQEKA